MSAVLFLFCTIPPVVAQTQQQSRTGTISGTVAAQGGEALAGAHAQLRGTRMGASSGVDGRFLIKTIEPAQYTLDVSYMGYKKFSRQVTVEAGKQVNLEVILQPEAFQIGEIQVVAAAPLIPRTPETKTVISSAEIEHYQASSVGDVLDVVPGVQKTANPGLGKTLQVGVRGDLNDPLTSFGTRIVVDGIPMSNNANLQFEKWTSSVTGASNVGKGVDLRTIPADNIEAVEVYRGLPSVRYGELTAGLVTIRTKTGPQPNRLKVKSNPDTWEGNLGGGFAWEGMDWSYNVNAARSERDIRIVGDEYTRLTGQMNNSIRLAENTLVLNNKLFFQRVFDECQPSNDAARTENYNRGFSINYGMTGTWKLNDVSAIDFTAYLNYRRENSMRSKLVMANLHVLPNGDTISSYVGKVETRGNEWSLGGRLEWQRTFIPDEYVHQVLVGFDVEYNANTGEGVLIDTVFNYYGLESGRGAYPFDKIPGQVIASLYAEDKITGNLGIDFSWVIGARYEMYRPHGMNFEGLIGKADFVQAHQGSFLNPRTTLLLYFAKGSQMRVSAGYVSKSPPMSTLFAPPTVLRWRNPLTLTNMYFKWDEWAPNLRAFRERQYEIGYDQTISNMFGVSANAYYKYRYDNPGESVVPIFVYGVEAGKPKVMYVGDQTSTVNLGWNVSKGIELTLRSRRIEELNLDLNIVGSYNHYIYGYSGTSFDGTPDTSIGETPNYKVPGIPIDTLVGFYYPKSGSWTDNILINYYVRYTVPSLGLWVTFRAEQTLMKRHQPLHLKPVDLSKLTPTDLADRLFETDIREEPTKWLLNLNISKSLFKGAELSFYVNNFLDDPAIYRSYQNAAGTSFVESSRNPELFYGLEFSMSFDAIFK